MPPLDMQESRLIPACAGKTWSRFPSPKTRSAHPRVCGENVNWNIVMDFASGSSPRVRGKLHRVHVKYLTKRLIPACAGKTRTTLAELPLLWAHPRVCGENGLNPCCSCLS